MRHILMLPVALSLSACSTLGTVLWRPTSSENLPNNLARGTSPTVSALSMDASRRLVMSQLIGTDRHTCSEPPPDAATSLLAKSAFEGTVKAGTGEYGGKLNDEFATTALALAQRSSNVEIWRTTSSTFCTLLMNGWTTAAYEYLARASAFAVKVDDPRATKPPPEKPSRAESLEAVRSEIASSKAAIQVAERDKKRAEADAKSAREKGDTVAARKFNIIAQEAEKKIADATFAKVQAEDEVAANR